MKRFFVPSLLALLAFQAPLRGEEATFAPTGTAPAEGPKWGEPGDGQKLLDRLAGSFSASIKNWPAPGAKPVLSKGTSVHSWTLGKRYLKQVFTSEWDGKPFQGLGYWAYDNVREIYQSVWMDNFMTGFMTAAGSYNRGTTTISQEGNFGSPLTGDKNAWFRTEWKIVDRESSVFSSYAKAENGKEYKTLEITYRRIK